MGVICVYCGPDRLYLGSDSEAVSNEGWRRHSQRRSKWAFWPCGCCGVGITGAGLVQAAVEQAPPEALPACGASAWVFTQWFREFLRQIGAGPKSDSASTTTYPCSGFYVRLGEEVFDFASDLDLTPVRTGFAASGIGEPAVVAAWRALDVDRIHPWDPTERMRLAIQIACDLNSWCGGTITVMACNSRGCWAAESS